MTTMQFAYNGNPITIAQPQYGYTSVINLPFDIERLSNGLYSVYDAGAAYDVRYCDCIFLLNATDTDSLLTFIDTTARGRSDITMTLSTNCGFFPFAPDRGDKGNFTVALEILSNEGVLASPYLYHRIGVRIINQGNYPAYEPPEQVSEGSLSIGSVDNLRFPPGWFKPDIELGVSGSMARDGRMLFVDRGAYADRHDNKFTLRCNQSKAAALLSYLTTNARANTFSLITQNNQYAFGMRSGSANSYTVRLIQDRLEVTHSGFNSFEINLALSREAIV